MFSRAQQCLITCGLLVVAWPTVCSAVDTAAAARNVTQLIAHRGASAERPENTLPSTLRAIEAGATAVEVDVRTTQDGHLVLLHDATLERATSGTGKVNEQTLAQLKQLDAGSKFSSEYRGVPMATLSEVLTAAKGKIDILLDLKETGDEYVSRVIACIRASGEPARTIVGVRNVEQARAFRTLLPEARQLGLIANPEEIEAYAQAGVEMIRLWPRWLSNPALVNRVRQAKVKLHLNGTTGARDEVLELLQYNPDSLSSDDPRRLVATLQELAAGDGATVRLHRIDTQNSAGLKRLLQFAPEPLPLVSAHRGGPQAGFPENCLATFENTLRYTYALLEIDPRHAKDGIVVHHDPTLDRTTTGRGPLSDHTLDEVKKLRLKDPAGNVTDHQIPTLDEVLEWARGKTILILDQKDVSVPDRVKAIEAHQAEHYAMLIVYSFQEARNCYRLNPNIMMEVMIPNRAKAAEFEQLGVPWKNVVAFVGHVPPEDRGLYELLHAKGVRTFIGTSRNLDRRFLTGQSEMAPLEPDYREFLARGADTIETDIPTQLGPLLYKQTAIPAALRSFFP